MTSTTFTSRRPPAQERCFTSPIIEQTIADIQGRLEHHEELAWLFGNCFPNTLDTTTFFTDGERPDTFIITGDIPAMWLRDSTAQVWPYLSLATEDDRLARMIQGLINRQTDCIRIDPYANAFNRSLDDTSKHASDRTDMRPGVWERKWEIDSLATPFARRTGTGRPPAIPPPSMLPGARPWGWWYKPSVNNSALMAPGPTNSLE